MVRDILFRKKHLRYKVRRGEIGTFVPSQLHSLAVKLNITGNDVELRSGKRQIIKRVVNHIYARIGGGSNIFVCNLYVICMYNNVVFSILLRAASDNSSLVLSSLCSNTLLYYKYWIKLVTLRGQQRPCEVAYLFIHHSKDTFHHHDEALVYLHFYQHLNVLH